MFFFDPPENIRKAKVSWCFQEDQKGTLARNMLIKCFLCKVWACNCKPQTTWFIYCNSNNDAYKRTEKKSRNCENSFSYESRFPLILGVNVFLLCPYFCKNFSANFLAKLFFLTKKGAASLWKTCRNEKLHTVPFLAKLYKQGSKTRFYNFKIDSRNTRSMFQICSS